MTASNTFTPTGNPRRRRSSGRTPREYLLHRMAQDRRECVKPMTMPELDVWMGDHVGAMEAEQNDASAEFVLGVELNSGFPDYLRRAVNPATVETGERFARVFVRFEYYSGRVVTVFPASVPQPDDVPDYRDVMDQETRAWMDESPDV